MDGRPNAFQGAPYLLLVLIVEYIFSKRFGRFVDSLLWDVR
jgi:hypothetical protein